MIHTNKSLDPIPNSVKKGVSLVSEDWEKNLQHLFKQAGVTLLEMMIAIAIVAIVSTIVVPSAQNILIQNRIVAEINELSGIIQFARNNAIDEQADTVLCPSVDFNICTNNWDDAKMVFADLDGNGERGADEELLVGTSKISDANNVKGPANPITFRASGAVTTPATLLLCYKNDDPHFARALTVSLQGRVRMSRDSNKDGVYESNDNTPLSCI